MISACLQNHNHGHVLGRALRAICEQPPMMFKVVDDGSTDDSRDIIRAAEREYPFVYPLYLEKQKDWPAIMWQQTALVRDDYVVQCAADDFLLPGWFNEASDAFRCNPDAGICFGDYWWGHINGNAIGPNKSGAYGSFGRGSMHIQRRMEWRGFFEMGANAIFREDAFAWLVSERIWELGPWSDSIGALAVAWKYGAIYLPHDAVQFTVQSDNPSYHQRVMADKPVALAYFRKVEAWLDTLDIAQTAREGMRAKATIALGYDPVRIS